MSPPRDDGFQAICRQLTGTPYIFHGYILDRHRGRIIWACAHRHTRRRGFSGSVFATECAARALTELLSIDERVTAVPRA